MTLPHGPWLGEGEGRHESALIQLGMLSCRKFAPERFRYRKTPGPTVLAKVQIVVDDVLGGIQCGLLRSLTLKSKPDYSHGWQHGDLLASIRRHFQAV